MAVPRAAHASTDANAPGRHRVGVRGLLVLVASFGAIFWAVRTLWHEVPINALVSALRSGTPAERQDAATRLGVMTAAEARVAVPALLEALDDPDEEVRVKAAASLGVGLALLARLDPANPFETPVLAALTAALRGPRTAPRIAAARSLAIIVPAYVASPPGPACPTTAPAVQALLALLKDPDPAVREAAVLALPLVLRGFDGDPGPARLALFRALKDPASPVRRAAADRAWIGWSARDHVSDELLRVVIDALSSPRTDLRFHAAQLLGQIGPRAEAAAPPLIARLKASPAPEPAVLPPLPNAFARNDAAAAATALGQISRGTPHARAAVTALAAALAGPGPDRLREAAAEALGDFPPSEGAPALPLLFALAGSSLGDDRDLTPAIITALGKLARGGPADAAAVSVLTRFLDAPEEVVQAHAAEALEHYGRRAAVALPRLRALAQPGPLTYIGENATKALRAIARDRQAPPWR